MRLITEVLVITAVTIIGSVGAANILSLTDSLSRFLVGLVFGAAGGLWAFSRTSRYLLDGKD